jgi:hypothetical protein
MARRSLVVASTVDPKKLAEADRRQFDLSVVRLGLARTTASESFAKRLGGVATPVEVSSEKLLELFKPDSA